MQSWDLKQQYAVEKMLAMAEKATDALALLADAARRNAATAEKAHALVERMHELQKDMFEKLEGRPGE